MHTSTLPKAISRRFPGFVQSELKRKAEIANGSFTTFSTQKTALSQTVRREVVRRRISVKD